MKRKNSAVILVAGIIAVTPFTGTFSAARNQSVQINTIVELEKLEHDINGKSITLYKPAKKVIPGNIVRYTVLLENQSSEPVDNAEVVTKIPDHMSYLSHSATGTACNIIFSTDKGKSFNPIKKLLKKTADGQLVQAGSQQITHIKWVRIKPLPPLTSQKLVFRAKLK